MPLPLAARMMVFMAAVIAASVGVAILRPALVRLRILDLPNARSSHGVPVPRGGGVAVMAAFLVAVGAATVNGRNSDWPLIAAAVAIAAVGFYDDVRTLGTRVRLVSQILAAGIVAGWAAGLSPPLPIHGALFMAMVVVGIVGYVNAFNFMDGINGISALNAAAAGAWFAYLGRTTGVDQLSVLGAAVAGVALGFLPWNAPTARIFLGDAGSYGLGLLISAMAVLSWVSGVGLLVSIAPLIIYGTDTLWVLIKRAADGRSLVEANREHVYQRLVDAGWAHFSAACVTVTAAGACIGISWWSRSVPPVTVSLLVLVACAYLIVPLRVGRRGGLSS